MKRAPKATGPSRLLAARERLAQPSQRRQYDGVAVWMRGHPEAVSLVEAWLEMRADGSTDWSLGALHRELMAAHGLPYRAPTALLRWMGKEYGLAYERAQGRG